MQTDLGNVTGMAVSNDGNVVYLALTIGPESLIRAINVSPNPVTLGSLTIQPGRISTIPVVATPAFGGGLSVLAVGPNGDLFVADATQDVNRIFRITPAGAATVFGERRFNTCLHGFRGRPGHERFPFKYARA